MTHKITRHVLTLAIWCSIFSPYEQFEVYWNVLSKKCLKRHINITLGKYGIRFNKDEEFYGEEVITFYERKIGLYPYYADTSDPSSKVNEGLPQLVNLTAHLEKAEKDIEKAIPNASFAGLAILDFEYWRPRYSLNWSSKKIYQTESERLVRAHNPSLTDAEVKRIAEQQFDEAAIDFMVETIRLGKRMRPNGKWGFYGLPYCNYDAGSSGENECTKIFQGHNDGIIDILDEATALFPSIYLKSKDNHQRHHLYVQAVLTETIRVLSKLVEIKKPIYTFSGIEYQPKTDPFTYYSKNDLCSTIKQAIDMGVQGTVIWSATDAMDKRCQRIAAYIDSKYGPYLENVRSKFDKCAQQKCHG